MIASIFIIIYVIFLGAGIIYVVIKREKYKAEVGFFIILIIYLISEVTYFLSFNLSAENYFDVPPASILWYISIVTRNLSIGIFASIHNIELNKDSKVRFLPVFVYIFLGGIILGLVEAFAAGLGKAATSYDFETIKKAIDTFVSVLASMKNEKGQLNG